MSRPTRLLSRVPLLLASIAFFVAPRAPAQITITFTSGQTNSTDYNTTFPNSPTLTIDTGTATLSGILSGTGSIEKTGLGTLILSGANTHSFTTVSAGTLALGATNALPSSGSVSVATGAALDVAGFTATIGTLSGSGQVALGSGSLTTGGANFGGVISGTGSLTLTGSSTHTLTGANTYSGGTTITSGLVTFSSADNFGTGSVTLAGGGLRWATGATTDLSSRLSALSPAGATFNTNGNNVTFASALTGTGGFTKTGAGSLTLSATNTYAGSTSVTGGNLVLGASNVIPDTSTVGLLATTTTLDLAGFSDTIGALFGNGNITLGSGTLAVGANDASTTFSGLISGSGSLVKVGTGTLTLSSNSSYSGGTTVSAGTLRFTGLNTSTLVGDITNHGTVDFGSSANLTYTGAISGSGTVVVSNGSTLTLTSAHTYTGPTSITGTRSKITLGASDRLPATTALSVDAGASLNLANFNQTLGSLTGSPGAVVNLGTGTLTVGAINTSTTFSGSIRDTGSLVKTGTGTLTLDGTNTYSGSTLITGGLINLNSSVSLGSGSHNITLNGGGLQWATGTFYDLSEQLAPLGTAGATFDTNGNTVTFGLAPLTGSGGLIKTGAGTLTLAAGATYTGNTTISSGTLELGGGTSLSGDITGPGALVKTGAGTATLTGTSITPVGGITVAEGTLVFGLGDRPFFSVPVVNHASLVFDSTGSGFFNSVISGTGSVTKTGSGSFSLNPANTYSGGTTVAAGTLEASGSFSELGTGNIAVTTGGQLNGGTSLNRTLTVDGAGSRFTTSGLRVGEASPGTVAVTNQGSVNASTVLVGYGNTGSLSVTGGGNVSTGFTAVGYAFSGPSGSVPGTGTLTLADGGRFSSGSDLLIGQGSTGTVSVTGPSSTLTVAALVNLGISGGTGTLTIGAGGTVSAGSLNLGHFSNDSATLNLATGGTLRVGGTVTGSLSPSSVFNFAGGTWQVTGSALSTALPLTLTNTSTLDTNGLNASLTGVLSGSGALTKTGAGTLTLAAANTYTGGTAITGGLVNFASSANFGAGSVTLDGGGLQWATGTSTDFSPRLAPLGAGGATFATNGNAVTFATALSGAGGLTKSGAGTLTLAAANTYTGGTTVTAGTLQLGNGGSLTGNVANQGTLVFNRSDDSAFAGIISGSGGVVLASGILRLTQAQTYTGPTQINSGILVLPTTTAQGLSASTLVTMASGAALDLSNRAQTLTGLVGAGTVYSYGGNSGSLELVVAPGQTQTFSGSLGGDYPAFALTKSGTGTLTLSGTHTYTGATAVNVGSLFVNGTLGATPLSLASGATLGGTGTLGGLTTLSSGAHLAPGNSPGTLTFTHGLTLLASSILDFELGTTSDLIRVSGGTLTGPTSGLVTLNLTDAGGFAAGTYTLFDFTSAATSSFDAADFTFGTTLPGYTYALSLTGGTLQLTATASAIPEPSTYAALLGAAALALAAHRRRQIRSHSS